MGVCTTVGELRIQPQPRQDRLEMSMADQRSVLDWFCSRETTLKNRGRKRYYILFYMCFLFSLLFCFDSPFSYVCVVLSVGSRVLAPLLPYYFSSVSAGQWGASIRVYTLVRVWIHSPSVAGKMWEEG